MDRGPHPGPLLHPYRTMAHGRAAGPPRIGYLLSDWSEAGGLKWVGKLQNIGLAGEVFTFTDVGVGEPDDATYMPSVGGPG